MQFDLQPTLQGKLLNLRPLKAEDFESLFAVSSDPLVWEQHPERFRYKREVFEGFFSAAMHSKGALLATDAATGEVIGSSRYTGLNLQANRVEVGYTFLACRCWGKGYNSEMKRLMLTHAFQFVDQVVFYVGEQNKRSQLALKNIGARFLDVIERQPAEGNKYNSVVFGMSKNEFLNGPLITR